MSCVSVSIYRWKASNSHRIDLLVNIFVYVSLCVVYVAYFVLYFPLYSPLHVNGMLYIPNSWVRGEGVNIYIGFYGVFLRLCTGLCQRDLM